MSVWNIFASHPAFSMMSMTRMINEEPFIPSLASTTIDWEDEPISNTTVTLDIESGELRLIDPAPRNAPAQTIPNLEETQRAFRIPHYRVKGFISADSVQGVRQLGTENQVKTVTGEVQKWMRRANRMTLDPTLEFQRLTALKGIIMNQSGSTMYNLFTEFEVSQPSKPKTSTSSVLLTEDFVPTTKVYLPLISTKFTTSIEDAVLDLVNQRRAEAGCGPVKPERSLHEAAYLHSKDMADNRYFSHTGLDGSRFWQRAERAGYEGFAAGENIAAGQRTPESVMTAWMNSTGHRNNILNCRHTHLGMGHYYGSGSRYGHYWTQVFGRE
ncbi:MAG: major capsid protein [Pseudomonadota bacterium]